MAAGIGAWGGAGSGAGPERVRRSGGAALAFGALCGLLLIAAAGCTSRPEPRPLMTDTLLLMPVDHGRLSSGYGTRYHPILKRRQMHRGIDWAAPQGTPVRAAGDGVVVAAGRFGAYGHYVRIDHGGEIATAYAHLERYARGLRPGLTVRQGEPIAGVGSTGRATGPHLHYEVLVAGRQVDPLAFAQAAVVSAAASSDGAPAAAGADLVIGGPDAAAEAGLAPAAPPVRGQPAGAIDRDARILVADLLRATASGRGAAPPGGL
jgi:murein DD-endopeptidase MepM/ murein hydrolase activator NlpD